MKYLLFMAPLTYSAIITWFCVGQALDVAIANSDIRYYRKELDREIRMIVKLEHRLYYERKLASEYRSVAGSFGVVE